MLDFQISQGSVATHLRWGGSLHNRSVDNFLQNLTVKELWKLAFICRSHDQKTKWLFFFGTRCILLSWLSPNIVSQLYLLLMLNRVISCVTAAATSAADTATVFSVFWVTGCQVQYAAVILFAGVPLFTLLSHSHAKCLNIASDFFTAW